MGTGNGYLASEIAHRFPEIAVAGTDIAFQSIRLNQKLQQEQGIKNLEFISYDDIEFPFDEAVFGGVISRYAFHHFPDANISVQEFYRIVETEGFVINFNMHNSFAPRGIVCVRRREGYRMSSTGIMMRWTVLVGIGFACGIGITTVDSLAFEGEVSPIVIVAMMLVVTVTAGAIWGRRGWVVAAAEWVCLPLAHPIKHMFGLPDTLHPNTYASILMLAAFSLVVAAIGMGCGVLLRRLKTGGVREGPRAQ